jgi:spermidine synthase
MLAAASGCAALAHELLWTRRLIDLLGASAASSTRVFSCFFLGLALGAAAAPNLLHFVRRPWRALALAEAGVAVLALPGLCLSQWSQWIWPALGSERLLGWEGSAVKLVLSAVVILPPAFCMGLSLPLLARAVLRGHRDLTRHGVWLYATNTMGGVVGLVFVSLVTLHVVGADGSMWIAIGLNLLVAVGCLLLDRTSPSGEGRTDAFSQEYEVPGRVLWPALAAAFVSGAGVLAFEVLALQMVGLAAPLSFYAPMAVLTVVILLLGAAALVVPLLARWTGGPCRVLWAAMLGASVSMAAAPFWFFQVTQGTAIGPRATLAAFLAVLVGIALAALGPSLLLAGLVFPSVLAWFGGEGGDKHGRHWGWLLAANGLGGLLGAELTYRAVAPATGIHAGMGSVAVLYGVASLTWVLFRGPRRAGTLTPSVAVTVLAVGLTLGPLSQLPQLNWRGVEILDEQTGREGTVAVVDSEDMGRRIVMSNQYVLGGTKFRYDQARLAHLPLVMHPKPRRTAFIGLATGITPGAALEHRCVESLTAVELSPLVVRAADKYFRPFNHDITRDRRAAVVVEDGRTYLAATPSAFDVVVGDLFLPWAPGEGRLYSVEQFKSVRDALRPGGLFCQWLAMYQLTPEQFDLIQTTFCRVFPRAYVFQNTFDCREPALALVGFRDRELDWSTIRARCAAVRRTNEVLDPLIRHADGVAMLYLGSVEGAGASGERVNTLSNMRLELAAGRERVTGQPGAKYLSGEKWLRFAYGPRFSQLGSTGRQLAKQVELTWMSQRLSLCEAARLHPGPLSAEEQAYLLSVQEEIQRDFPDTIRADAGADWSQWPGDATLFRK